MRVRALAVALGLAACSSSTGGSSTGAATTGGVTASAASTTSSTTSTGNTTGTGAGNTTGTSTGSTSAVGTSSGASSSGGGACANPTLVPAARFGLGDAQRRFAVELGEALPQPAIGLFDVPECILRQRLYPHKANRPIRFLDRQRFGLRSAMPAGIA